MAEITAITPQVKDKTRCNVYIDGVFCCGLTLEAVVSNRLKVGGEISPDELSRIQLESEKHTALDKALTHISHSMKTEKEMRTFLKGKGYLDEVVDYVVGKMREYSYLNDEAYASAYAESAGKRKGKRLIAMELRSKGISDEAIACALEETGGEEESACALLEKYLRGKTVDQKTLAKAYAYLLGKGFSGDTVKAALKNYGETDED